MKEEVKAFISVYRPMGGWKPIKYWWNTVDFDEGFWEPWETYPFVFATKDEAVVYAKAWALEEALEYKDGN